MNHRRWIPALVLMLVLVTPELLHACPVCFDQREKNRIAFFTTTIFLSLLPLGMAGGLWMFVRHRARALSAAAAATTLPEGAEPAA